MLKTKRLVVLYLQWPLFIPEILLEEKENVSSLTLGVF